MNKLLFATQQVKGDMGNCGACLDRIGPIEKHMNKIYRDVHLVMRSGRNRRKNKRIFGSVEQNESLATRNLFRAKG